MYLVPWAIYREQALFSAPQLSTSEIARAQRLSQFLAAIANEPDLALTSSDSTVVRVGLARIAAWFTALCSDNATLSRMIYTLNDGPFFGTRVMLKAVGPNDEIDSLAIAGKPVRLVSTRVGPNEEPVIALVRVDGSVVWAQRMSGAPNGRVRSLRFQPIEPLELPDYGYRVRIVVEWTYGAESGEVYLDNDVNLRFYFLSW